MWMLNEGTRTMHPKPAPTLRVSASYRYPLLVQVDPTSNRKPPGYSESRGSICEIVPGARRCLTGRGFWRRCAAPFRDRIRTAHATRHCAPITGAGLRDHDVRRPSRHQAVPHGPGRVIVSALLALLVEGLHERLIRQRAQHQLEPVQVRRRVHVLPGEEFSPWHDRQGRRHLCCVYLE